MQTVNHTDYIENLIVPMCYKTNDAMRYKLFIEYRVTCTAFYYSAMHMHSYVYMCLAPIQLDSSSFTPCRYETNASKHGFVQIGGFTNCQCC